MRFQEELSDKLDFTKIISLLFPNGLEKVMRARMEALSEMREVSISELPNFTIFGGRVKIEVTFRP